MKNRKLYLAKIIVSILAMAGVGMFVPGLVNNNMALLVIGAIILGSIVLGSIIYRIYIGYHQAKAKDLQEQQPYNNHQDNHDQYKK